MSNILVQASNIPYIYSHIRKGSKQHFEVILEPFQAILQLALLSHCPIGTKISIKDNCVYLQQPSYSQGLVRWYNNDNKEDLVYLFQVCRRFPVFYSSLRKNYRALYTTLVTLAQEGIQQLIQTYQDKERLVLLHILHLFKELLEKADEQGDDDCDSDGSLQTCYNTALVDIHLGASSKETTSATNDILQDDAIASNVEGIFKQISEIYSEEHYGIVESVLKLLGQTEDETKKKNLIDGLQSIMETVFSKIKVWISEHVLF